MKTREKIIEKTFELLLYKGYDGVSISDIQKITGTARGLLYHYFGSKEALFIEASEYHFIKCFRVDLSLIQNYDVPQTIDFFVSKYQDLIQNTLKGVSIINYDFLFYRLVHESEEFFKLYEEIRQDEFTVWKIAVGNSNIREGLDTDKIARQFIITMDGVWMRAVTPKIEIDLIEALREALETFYNLIKK